ncbi:N-acetylmuramoyl-L-alanine amidase [Roseburia sp. NSJ-9]|uniref:N-acetylmuramoyl-L-alanine amidase n=1 Tax=Roseburia lenta TaxID=2763061 RepID=A0ABR7GDM6_9FIRM|nr:N-acetylmuramoyl-L-alanine amidase [Roseburia lenta]MBC5685524.1 N-acetylmuramoyl-L-alanine amidase [Roseburia lenta]
MMIKKKRWIPLVILLAIVCAILLAGFAYKKYKGILPEEDTSEQADDSVTEEDKTTSDQTDTDKEQKQDDMASDMTTEEPAANSHVVVIDPGHQGRGDSSTEPNGPGSSTMKARVTGGTHGTTTGVYEYQLTLVISQQLQAELENRGYTVYMTRTSHDVNISNMERAQYATSVGGEIAVRIHANGVDNASVSGALALAPSSSNPYIAYLSDSSWNLSKCILDAYCAATGMRNQGVSTSDTMTGINWSTVPVTILEMGYMTNPTDDVNMEDPAYQARMVQGIADGIDAYFGL